MMKMIIGVKGTGKTKQLIELVNIATKTSSGNVVCLEKGNKLRFDINYQARLIDTDEYSVCDATTLYGFIAGLLAGNHDITDIFVDSALKICGNDMAEFEQFLEKLALLDAKVNTRIVMTSSIPVEEATETVKKFVLPPGLQTHIQDTVKL